MAAKLITEHIWRDLAVAAKRTQRPTFAAVAYLGKAAGKLLPFRRGSRLVVDASPAAVAAGQTCPSELELLARRGVRVFSVENLHSKVFVIGNRAYVGSANASHHSAQRLLEAVMTTADPRTVLAARSYVRRLCQHELGPEELQRLKKLYRPPRIAGGYPRRRRSRSVLEQGLPRLRIIQLRQIDPPHGTEEMERTGERAAKRKMMNRRTHALETIWLYGGRTSLEHVQLVQVFQQEDGQKFVEPPGVVVHTESRRRRKMWFNFIFVEVPKRRRKSLPRLAKQLGYGAKKLLNRTGWVRNEVLAEKIRTAWGI